MAVVILDAAHSLGEHSGHLFLIDCFRRSADHVRVIVTQHVWFLPRGVLSGGCRVQLCHEFPAGCAGGGEVLVALVELEAQVDDALFEGGVLLLELVDVVGSAEPGFPPCVLAEQAGEPAFELLDPGVLAVRCWALSRSACRDALLAAGPVPVDGAWAWNYWPT